MKLFAITNEDICKHYEILSPLWALTAGKSVSAVQDISLQKFDISWGEVDGETRDLST